MASRRKASGMTTAATKVSFGERRHELCRFGRLTEAYEIEGGKETAGTAPLCTFPTPDQCPPAMTRAWSGLIDVERDCALCFAFKEI